MSFMPDISQLPSPLGHGEQGNAPTLEEVEACLLHPEVDMRRLAVLLLKQWGLPHSVPGLLRAAMDRDVRVNGVAWQALNEFGDEIVEALVRSLESPHVEERLAAVIVLRERGFKQVRHAVEKRLRDSEPGVHREALITLTGLQ